MGQRLTRVYPNGDKRVFNTDEPAFWTEYNGVQGKPDSWFDYNSTMRFGCLLFIDGKCVYWGGKKQEHPDVIAFVNRIEAEEQAIISGQKAA